MGVDIGDLGAVFGASESSQLSAASRTAGRTEGNSFIATVANARPHDLFFFEEPEAMLRGHVEPPPECNLNAPAVLERQLFAFAIDNWASGVPDGAIPDTRGGARHC